MSSESSPVTLSHGPTSQAGDPAGISAPNAPGDLEKKDSVSTAEQIVPTLPLPLSEFPDGGFQAWLQVAGSFFLIFVAWGTFNTFGAFQTFYAESLLTTNSPSAISWIGSIEGFLILLCGFLSGPAFDLGYFRALISVGSFMIVFGLMMTSLSTTYYQAFLSQGICMGIGSGLVFAPSVAIVATYFKRKRAFAVGIAICGSSLGGIVYPAIFRQLQPQIGFPWTVRVMAFIMIGLLAFSLSVMRPRFTPKTRRSLLELSAFTEAPYALFAVGSFLSFVGAFIPFFYGPAYTEARTGASTSLAFYIIAVLNGGSVVGRLISNFFADTTGPLNILVPCAVATSIFAFCWIPVDSAGGMVVFCAFYGLTSGAMQSLSPAALASLTPDISRVGTRVGMNFGITGLGLLIGTPIAGALVDLKTGTFVRAQVFNGVIVMGAALFMGLARVAKSGRHLRVWA